MLTLSAIVTTKPGAESEKGLSGGSSRIEITSGQEQLQTRGQQKSLSQPAQGLPLYLLDLFHICF